MQKTSNNITIRRADWHADQSIISDIRRRVFIEEQHVPEALEWDGLDDTAIHVLGSIDGDAACATARLLNTGQIGRMAVLPAYRHRGLGSALVTELLSAAADGGMHEVFLHAQLRAQRFYERHGFTPVGDIFEDAGIPHIAMTRPVG